MAKIKEIARKLEDGSYEKVSLGATNVSELNNDSGFITNTVSNLTNYYAKTETYTQDEVKALIDAITTLNIEVVTELPTENISSTTIYLKGTETAGTNDYEEWIYTANNDWEMIGTTAVDLSNYATKDEIPTNVSELENDSGYLTTIPDEYITETELNNKGYITNTVSNLTNYYTKTEIYTQQEVDNKLQGAISLVNIQPYEGIQEPIMVCLTFESEDEDFTLATYDAAKHWDGTLEYSTDTSAWFIWDGTTTLSSAGKKLYLRGINNTKITGGLGYRWVLTGSNIKCLGNIEALLDYIKVAGEEHPTMASYCYDSLFYGCSSLITAPELPAIALKSYCYKRMFQGCTSLILPPVLPATTLADYCYDSMFYGCSSLIATPELPAMTLTRQCYYKMFYNCTSLVLPCVLPATTLAYDCYEYMFYECTSLTTLPKIPATTMANYCCQFMFYGCSKIKVSETQTGIYQYEWRIPTEGEGTEKPYCFGNMLYRTGGTYTSNPVINTTYYVENQPI